MMIEKGKGGRRQKQFKKDRRGMMIWGVLEDVFTTDPQSTLGLGLAIYPTTLHSALCTHPLHFFFISSCSCSASSIK